MYGRSLETLDLMMSKADLPRRWGLSLKCLRLPRVLHVRPRQHRSACLTTDIPNLGNRIVPTVYTLQIVDVPAVELSETDAAQLSTTQTKSQR